jgi:UDP:flavonoid glycosyltransferase YjiC (YdhE family)
MTTVHLEPVNQTANGIEGLSSTGMKRPYLLFGAFPAAGHTLPLIRIASELVQRGFDIIFLAGEEFKDKLETAGIKHITLPPIFTPEGIKEREKYAVGYPQLAYDLNAFVVNKIPERWEMTKRVLESLRTEDPSREIVLATEPFFVGAIPMLYGAPLPKGFSSRPKVVNISPLPYCGESIDLPIAIGTGLLPDSTESGRRRNEVIRELLLTGPFADTVTMFGQIIKDTGGSGYETCLPYNTLSSIFDLTIQLCPRSVEFDYADLQPRTMFAGALHPNPLPADFDYPSWWDDVTKGGKRVVFVAQGTVALNYTHLIMPTIRALADRDDFLVVATLGRKGLTLPTDFELPANTRVIDYLDYDAILPYASLFVMNAGYGGFLHGVVHGVPMVLAGESEDKKDVAARGEYAGVAVNLRTGKPSVEQVRSGVNKLLNDPGFKQRAITIKRENEQLDVISTVEREILAFVAT